MTVRRSFGLDRVSVGASRKFVAETLADLPEDIRESAVLMMSELATNAVVHTLTGFEVCIDRSATQVRVEVADVGEGEPRLRSPSSSEPHGRGLRIVEELSDQWGMVESDDHAGKSVWFAVRLDPASASGAEVAASEGRRRRAVVADRREAGARVRLPVGARPPIAWTAGVLVRAAAWSLQLCTLPGCSPYLRRTGAIAGSRQVTLTPPGSGCRSGR